MLFKLEKPTLSKVSKEDISKALTDEKKTEVFDFIKKSVGSEYLYWDQIRHKEPSPKRISKEALWVIVKLFRESQSIKTVSQMPNNCLEALRISDRFSLHFRKIYTQKYFFKQTNSHLLTSLHPCMKLISFNSYYFCWAFSS